MSYQSTHVQQEAQDGPSSERDRHFHVYRTLRGPAEVAQGEGRDVRGRIGRCDGNSTNYASPLGIRGSLPDQRTNSTGCQCLEYQGFTAYRREKIKIFKKIYQLVKIALDNLPNGKYTNHTTLERVAYSENSKTRYPIIHDSLCCLRQNHCTCAGYALVNLCNPGRFVHVA